MRRQGPVPEASLVGSLLDGRYQVSAVLARGGMSTVYRGIDTRLERPVAIKVMDPRFAADPVFLARFEREARAAARLHHPGVVGVYDQGVDRALGQVFLVMELVDGGTLRQLLGEHGRLGVAVAFSVAEQVLSALASAHREGLVHRDVKPENVLIGRGGVVKVADFGLVRAAAEAGTATGDVILGTVAYLSPEQVQTGAADARSDVYAAGILLYEMLLGTPPHGGETALSVAYRHVNEDVPPLRARDPEIPEALDDLVLRATSRDPAARPADAASFLAELRRVRTELGMTPVAVPVPGAGAAPTTDYGPSGTRAFRRPQVPDTTPPAREVAVAPAPVPARGEPGRPYPDEDPYLRERTRNRRAFTAWLVVVLLLAGAVGTAAWWLGSGRWTSVPDLLGMRGSEVAAVLSEAGLQADVVEDHHDTVPSGTVISSDPGPGERAIRGSRITVVLSLGRPVVPDIGVGVSVEEAEQALREADLRPVRDPAADEYHDTVPEGAVIGLRPAPGTTLRVGDPVTLVVSKGVGPTTVPDVRGAPEAEAVAALREAGLLARIDRQFHPEVPGGRVISTDPGGGLVTKRGTEVRVLVSTALVVPDVLGRSREEALAALTDAGFAPEERGDGAGRAGTTVVGLSPSAGTLVDPADNRIVVRLTDRVVVPDVVGRSLEEAREILADLGLNSDVSEFFGSPANRVVAQFPAAGRAVPPGSTVRLTVF